MPERFTVEIEILFESWIHSKGLQVALFDLDDTLIDTDTLFAEQKAAYLEYCYQCLPLVDRIGLEAEFSRIDTESYQTVGVSPKKWEYVVSQLAKIYDTEGLKDGLGILHEIYNRAPVALDGIHETLSLCKKSGLRLGLVTHASQAWTDIKLDVLDLRGYFEHVKVVDVEEHMYKGPEHWQEELDLFGVDPRYILGVGDNLRGDIQSMHSVGVRTLAWIPSKWHVYNIGEVPDEVIRVDKIGNLITSLIGI